MISLFRFSIWYGSTGWGWNLYGVSYQDKFFLGFSINSRQSKNIAPPPETNRNVPDEQNRR